MNTPLNLVGPDYSDETSIVSAESTINMFPEISGGDGSRSRTVLRTHAGLTTFTTGLDGAGRGVREMGGVLYVVAGQVLYSIDSSGSAMNLGAILGSGRCVLTDNFIPDTRRQLVIMTGERAYVYDTQTGLAEVTDVDLAAVALFDTATTVDSYTIYRTEDGFIFSAVTDATDINALDFKTAESNSDRSVSVWEVYGDVWLLGAETIEVFRNTGDLDDPFQRVQTIDTGCGAKYSPQSLDNGVFWIDETGRVWRADGFNPVRVSDHAVEQYLSSVDYSQAFGFTYVDRGHEFYGFTVPGGKTFLYDVATLKWHRRKSVATDFWRVNGIDRCYGLELCMDYATGTVWKLDTSTVLEGTDRMPRERISGYLHDDTNPITVNRITLIADTGNALVTGTTPQTDPQIEMRYSDDGGRNWSTWQLRSLGLVGEYGQRINWTRLGQIKAGKQRAFHFRVTDPVRCDFLVASGNVEGGDQT